MRSYFRPSKRIKSLSRDGGLRLTGSKLFAVSALTAPHKLGREPMVFYLSPKKLNIAITMTTAPTSQMILFMTYLLVAWETRASDGGCWSTCLCRLILSRHRATVPAVRLKLVSCV